MSGKKKITRPSLEREVEIQYDGGRASEFVVLRCPLAGDVTRVRLLVRKSVDAAIAYDDAKKSGGKGVTPPDDAFLHAEVVKVCLPKEYDEWSLEEVFRLIEEVKGKDVSPLVVESYDLLGFSWYRSAVGLNDVINKSKSDAAERDRPGIGSDTVNP